MVHDDDLNFMKYGGDDLNIMKYGGVLEYRYFWYFVM